MFDAQGRLLYVGKAKNLKARLSHYFKGALDNKTARLVSQIHSIETTLTRNEREALLLENNLIKEHKPRYNVLFRDDKSYPYLKLDTQELFPRLSLERGRKKDDAAYFGPYSSTQAAREALHSLQNIFQLRHCTQAFFENRTRPCLQFQIKRCSAPCVGVINQEAYKADVEHALLFLGGKNKAVIDHLVEKMQTASVDRAFEKAARIRDQIARLRHIQAQQIILNDSDQKTMDVLGIALQADKACVYQLMMREGRMLGGRAYFLKQDGIRDLSKDPVDALLERFILQHYLQSSSDDESIPSLLLLPQTLSAQALLGAVLSEKAQAKVVLSKASRGAQLKLSQMASMNAKAALERQGIAQDLTIPFEALETFLDLKDTIESIDCVDVSHLQGDATVFSCVVFDRKGPLKSAYKRFNIRGHTRGNDIAAMTEGLTRRYSRLKSEGGLLPSILLVDGGRGQLGCAKAVLEALQISGIILLGIAKGPKRKAGLETIYAFVEGTMAIVQPEKIVLRLFQQIRDEAHRFAIKGHRQRRARAHGSILEGIPGIGPQKRMAILQHFGGLQEVSQASIEALAGVRGIQQSLAEKIYERLHGR